MHPGTKLEFGSVPTSSSEIEPNQQQHAPRTRLHLSKLPTRSISADAHHPHQHAPAQQAGTPHHHPKSHHSIIARIASSETLRHGKMVVAELPPPTTAADAPARTTTATSEEKPVTSSSKSKGKTGGNGKKAAKAAKEKDKEKGGEGEKEKEKKPSKIKRIMEGYVKNVENMQMVQ